MPRDPESDMTPDDIMEVEPEKGDSIFDQFSPPQPMAVSGPDGLAMDRDPVHSFDDALPPPLAPSTFSCLAQPATKNRDKPLPPCKWYKRQRYSSQSTPGATQIDRYCIHPSQRGINGACVILRDAAIYQCELRTPSDPASAKVLDAIDDEKIALGEERLELELSKRKAIDDGEAAMDAMASGKPRKARKYRMFRTPEDVDAGRTTLDEDDFEDEGTKK